MRWLGPDGGRRQLDFRIRYGRLLDFFFRLLFLLRLFDLGGGLRLLLQRSWAEVVVAFAWLRYEWREVHDNRIIVAFIALDGFMPMQQRKDQTRVDRYHNRRAQSPARNFIAVLNSSDHECFSTPTNATFTKPASRSRFITSMRSP